MSGQLVPRLGQKRPATSDVASGTATENGHDDVQRWTARRRMTLVLSILKGEITAEECARQYGLTVVEIEEWKERMLVASQNALRARPRDSDAMKDDQIRRLQQKIGELVLDVDLLKEALHNIRSQGVEPGND